MHNTSWITDLLSLWVWWHIRCLTALQILEKCGNCCENYRDIGTAVCFYIVLYDAYTVNKWANIYIWLRAPLAGNTFNYTSAAPIVGVRIEKYYGVTVYAKLMTFSQCYYYYSLFLWQVHVYLLLGSLNIFIAFFAAK